MTDFRSFKTAKRAPAEPMQPVVDPAAWSPEALADVSRWSYRITEQDADDLAQGVAAVRRQGLQDVRRVVFFVKVQAAGDGMVGQPAQHRFALKTWQTRQYLCLDFRRQHGEGFALAAGEFFDQRRNGRGVLAQQKGLEVLVPVLMEHQVCLFGEGPCGHVRGGSDGTP